MNPPPINTFTFRELSDSNISIWEIHVGSNQLLQPSSDLYPPGGPVDLQYQPDTESYRVVNVSSGPSLIHFSEPPSSEEQDDFYSDCNTYYRLRRLGSI